jgi:hypothetical protein
MKKVLAAALVAACVAAVLAGPASAQCVMCKTALTGSAEGRGISGQFNRAILVMVFAPYLVMGAFLLGLFRARLRYHAGRAGARIRARLHVGPTRRPAAVPRAIP